MPNESSSCKTGVATQNNDSRLTGVPLISLSDTCFLFLFAILTVTPATVCVYLDAMDYMECWIWTFTRLSIEKTKF